AIANKNKQGSILQVQERIITGIVTDEDGRTLPGTTVYLKNMQSRKVIADGNGVYRITVPVGANQRLVFSFVGMETKEVTIQDKDQLNVQLLLAENTLGEAVIVGAYGTQQKRSDLVGSAYQVNNSSFKNLPAQRIDNLLEGLVP